MSRRASAVLNFAFTQLGWFAGVLCAAAGWYWWGTGIIVALAGLHVWLAQDRRVQIRLLAVAGAYGFLVETVQQAAGVYTVTSGVVVPGLVATWILALWMQFAGSFTHSLSWMAGRPWVAVAFGAVGGPLGFLGGERLGAVTLGEPRALALASLAMVWAAGMPLLVVIADRIRTASSGRFRLPGRAAQRVRTPS